MSKLEAIVEELKSLPFDRLERGADYIHRLKTINRVERNEILRSTAGILAGARGQEFARNIDEGCGNVDELEW
jgi:hypothetical protein